VAKAFLKAFLEGGMTMKKMIMEIRRKEKNEN